MVKVKIFKYTVSNPVGGKPAQLAASTMDYGNLNRYIDIILQIFIYRGGLKISFG